MAVLIIKFLIVIQSKYKFRFSAGKKAIYIAEKYKKKIKMVYFKKLRKKINKKKLFS